MERSIEGKPAGGFLQSGFFQGVLWSSLAYFTSALNDMLVKYVGLRLDPAQVAFFRFFFSAITLLPFMLCHGRSAFHTRYLGLHSVRSLLLWMSISLWCYGVVSLPLTLATTLSFATPLFVLILASFFLNERIGWQRALATCVGFCGIVVSAQPSAAGIDFMALILIVSTVIFAVLDVMNKKLLIADEPLLPMLFYSALGTALLSAPPAILCWQPPHWQEIFYLFLLGGGANLILFFLLKSFTLADVSALQPVRYAELLFSALLSWVVFQQWPTFSTLLGAALIVPATLFITWHETQQKGSH